MKRSLFLLASLALTSALYAQPGASFTREQILDIFEQYNPSVLQKAAEQPDRCDIRCNVDNAVSLHLCSPVVFCPVVKHLFL